MPVERMREILSDVYPYPWWIEKVSKMSNSQVIAVYHKFLRAGEIVDRTKKIHINKKTNKAKPKKRVATESIDDIQITFDDVLLKG